MDVGVHIVGKRVQDTYLGQCRHGHQDAQEEQDGGHINRVERRRNAATHLRVNLETFYPNLGHTPDDTQRKHDAHKGGQARNSLENRNEQQSRDTDNKHCLAQVGMALMQARILVRHRGDGLHLTFLDKILSDEHWHHHGDDTGNEQIND